MERRKLFPVKSLNLFISDFEEWNLAKRYAILHCNSKLFAKFDKKFKKLIIYSFIAAFWNVVLIHYFFVKYRNLLVITLFGHFLVTLSRFDLADSSSLSVLVRFSLQVKPLFGPASL